MKHRFREKPAVTTSIRSFLRDESGATALEYGLIAGILCVGVVGFVGVLGDTAVLMYTMVADAVAEHAP